MFILAAVRMNILPSEATFHHAWRFEALLIKKAKLLYTLSIRQPDDRGSTNIWNVGLLQRVYTERYPRRLSSSYLPLLETNISQCKIVTLILLVIRSKEMFVLSYSDTAYVHFLNSLKPNGNYMYHLL
jgi:hypothetical protein